MMETGKGYGYHLMAIFAVAVWGTTFVSTKVLIYHGLHPAEILLYRFILAYVCIWFFSPRKLLADSAADECWLVAAGLCGGSLYFAAENTALGITLASNVALIICTAPILTALLGRLFYRRERVSGRLIAGSLLALGGVALVVLNGSFILKLSPAGDFLTLLAALLWAFYCLILKRLGNRYPTLFITRKVFFYGVVTLLPYFFFRPLHIRMEVLAEPVVWGNLLFLGVIASMLCYFFWNLAVRQLGPLATANYIYIVPLVTLFTSSAVIEERITSIALLGSALILCGVYVTERGVYNRLPGFFSVKRFLSGRILSRRL